MKKKATVLSHIISLRSEKLPNRVPLDSQAPQDIEARRGNRFADQIVFRLQWRVQQMAVLSDIGNAEATKSYSLDLGSSFAVM
jgi:hypothetical protein